MKTRFLKRNCTIKTKLTIVIIGVWYGGPKIGQKCKNCTINDETSKKIYENKVAYFSIENILVIALK